MRSKENSAMQEVLYNIDPIYEEISSTLFDSSENSIGEFYASDAKAITVAVLDGRTDSIISKESCGFSIRTIKDHKTFLTAQNNLKVENILQENKKFRSFSNSKGKKKSFSTLVTRNLYDNYFDFYTIKESTNILKEMNEYVKSKCKFAQKISCRLSMSVQEVLMITSEGKAIYDFRPLWALVLWNSLKKGSEVNENFTTFSFRSQLTEMQKNWKKIADNLIETNKIIISAQKATGGQMPVIFGAKNCGILLHEAIGHSLEADFNKRGNSVFSGKIGQKIASDCVTLVDDGTIPNARGTLNFDDEGTETQKNILVKDGILLKYLSDKYNAKCLGTTSTGSGRRDSFNFKIIPRMNNTYIESNNANFEDMISSIKKGVYAKSFSHGQVEISSGQFAFTGLEMYAIENGKITHPIKGCTFCGMGDEVMKNIQAVGEELTFDLNGGTCGKDGQNVPVGMGMPSVLVKSITVGG